MKFAYIRTEDGGLSIVHAAPKETLERVLGPLTDEQYRQHIIERSIPADAQDVRELPDDWQPPAPRCLRNAWRHDGVDMPAAREIWRDHMRRARTPLLAALDIEAQQSLEMDGIVQEHTRKDKQALRYVTAHPDIESANDPTSLMNIWPDILGPKPT